MKGARVHGGEERGVARAQGDAAGLAAGQAEQPVGQAAEVALPAHVGAGAQDGQEPHALERVVGWGRGVTQETHRY